MYYPGCRYPPPRPNKVSQMNMLTSMLPPVPKSTTLQEIEQATQIDQQLQAVITAFNTGQWHPDIHRFYHSRSELTVTETN